MVPVLDGNSENVAHVRSKIGFFFLEKIRYVTAFERKKMPLTDQITEITPPVHT